MKPIDEFAKTAMVAITIFMMLSCSSNNEQYIRISIDEVMIIHWNAYYEGTKQALIQIDKKVDGAEASFEEVMLQCSLDSINLRQRLTSRYYLQQRGIK